MGCIGFLYSSFEVGSDVEDLGLESTMGSCEASDKSNPLSLKYGTGFW